MSELLAFYANQTPQQDFPALSALKKAALQDFLRLGFPTRHDEAWKYTAPDAFSKLRFNTASTSDSTPLNTTNFPIECAIYTPYGECLTAHTLPEGVIIESWAQAMSRHAEKIAPYLNRIMQHQHGFQALNTMMLEVGLFIYIPENVQVHIPLLISHTHTISQSAKYIRHLVLMEKGSELLLIEDYQGQSDFVYFTNTITEVSLKTNAHLKHIKLQRESLKSFHVGELAVSQEQKSRLESHSFSVGGQWVRSDTQVHFKESQAACLLNGIYMTQEGQHVDHHTVVHHKVGQCHSEQDYKGMLSGHSRAVFNGAVLVDPKAQQTVAKQQNKNLLLSKMAEVDTKPELQIYADDVICTHGATVGQLDEDALFYLATRGIPEEEARYFLVHAFVEENLRQLNSQSLATWLAQQISQHLGW